MRILLITDFYWPYLGGVEQHVRSLGQALTADGHQVTVATLARADLADEEWDGTVSVRRMRSTTQRVPRLFSTGERPWAPPVADPAITLQLRALIAEQRPHIVHGHDWLSRSFLPLRRWSERRFGTRLVSSLHYYTLSCARKDLMQATSDRTGPIERPCSGPGWKKCLGCASRHYGSVVGPVTALANLAGAAAERRGATATIAVSAACARGNGLEPVDRLVGDRSADRLVKVIPNFLAPRVASGRGPTLDDGVRERLTLLPDDDFILFVGDLRPMKGIDILLEAYTGLAPAMPLVLIGKTWPDTPTELPDGVAVHDRWPNEAVVEAWRRSSIGVMPSVWAEPFGIVIIEAMAGGTAIIASSCGGIPEIVQDGTSGLLVPPGDADALRDALALLVADPGRRAALGRAARHRAAQFTAAAVVPGVVDVYRAARKREARSRTTSA